MIYSIGHSTLKENEFVELMGKVPVLIDVRSHPGSKAHPQFNKSDMQNWLPKSGKKYEWFPGLGGWDIRHVEDVALRDKMNNVGVDLAVYSKGLFPKQRIAGYRLDMELIRRQHENGCNCDIDNKLVESIDFDLTDIPEEGLQYLRQLYNRLIVDRQKVLDKKLGTARLFESIDDLAPKDLIKLSLAYKKLITSSSKMSKEISPCKWMPKSCDCCGKPTLAPTWWSQGLYDYAYFMILDEFKQSAIKLIERSKIEDLATCCCENLYYKCHRSLIADFCLFMGYNTYHIQSNGKFRPHSEVIGDRIERYPKKVIDTWKIWYKDFKRSYFA